MGRVIHRSHHYAGSHEKWKNKWRTEKPRNVWLLYLPSHAHVDEVMQELFGVKHEAREQHKEVSKARQSGDVNDTLEIISYLIEQSTFTSDPVLHSLDNDMTAES